MLIFLRRTEWLIRMISLLALLALAASVVAWRGFGLALFPAWVSRGLLPVLTAGAIGYFTNCIAIWMLFKPYRRRLLFGFNVQGVIPREQPRLAAALGEEIPAYLLKPEEIVTELSALAGETLQDPALLEQLRGRINRFTTRYSEDIAGFLAPHIEAAFATAVRENLQPENLRAVYDAVIPEFLGNAETRTRLAAGITGRMKEATPALLAAARPQLRSGLADYVRKEYPAIGKILPVDRFAARLDEHLNWHEIEQQVGAKLGTPEIQQAIGGELLNIAAAIREYLGSPAAESELRKHLDAGAARLENFIRRYLAEKLPGLVDAMLRRDEFWATVETQILPAVKTHLDHYLRREGREIIAAKLDLSGRIERSVNALDMAELHAMINKIAGEHLCAIQVLGFFLGLAAGLLLALLG